MPISLDTPTPLADAIAQIDAKTPIGSTLRSKEWEAMPVGLRQGALFSAGVESARLLGRVQTGLQDVLAARRDPKTGAYAMDRAKLVADLQKLAISEGLTPQDPAKRGTIQDVTTERRLKLVIETQLGMANGHAYWKAGMDPDVLDGFPAQELVRIAARRVPRDWFKRWLDAKGDLPEGRMVALKTSTIWRRISRFGVPWTPLDYNSGMGLDEIPRDEAEGLGLLSPDTKLSPDDDGFAEELRASVRGLDPKMRDALKHFFGEQIEFVGEGVRGTKGLAPAPTPPPPGPAPQPPPTPATPPSSAPGPQSTQEIRDQMGQVVADFKKPEEDLWKVLQKENSKSAKKKDDAKINQITGQLVNLFQERAKKLHEVVQIPPAQRGQVTFKNPLPVAIANKVQKGAEITAAYTAPKFLPELIAVELPANQRAFYMPLYQSIHLRPSSSVSTAAHEMTHGTEDQNASIKAKAGAFLTHRAAGGPLKLLSQITGNTKYGPDEWAYEDEWVQRGGDAYSGKWYPDGLTELLTMGIERLHADPWKFAQTDPEYFDFVVNTLRGW